MSRSANPTPTLFRGLPAYLGGKRRFCPLLFSLLAEHLPRADWQARHFLDPFSGGGAVSPEPPLLTFGKPAPDGLRERGDVAKRNPGVSKLGPGQDVRTTRQFPEARPHRWLPPRLRHAGGLTGDDLHGRRRRYKAPCRGPPPPRRDGRCL